MNSNLQLSDGLLTSFVSQSEGEILRLVHAAMLGKAPRNSSSTPRNSTNSKRANAPA